MPRLFACRRKSSRVAPTDRPHLLTSALFVPSSCLAAALCACGCGCVLPADGAPCFIGRRRGCVGYRFFLIYICSGARRGGWLDGGQGAGQGVRAGFRVRRGHHDRGAQGEHHPPTGKESYVYTYIPRHRNSCYGIRPAFVCKTWVGVVVFVVVFISSRCLLSACSERPLTSSHRGGYPGARRGSR